MLSGKTGLRLISPALAVVGLLGLAVFSGSSRETASGATPSPPLLLGIDRLLTEELDLVAGKRVGLITNQTGRGRDGEHDADRLARQPGLRLVALFSPEHGFRGTEPPGAYVASYVDPVLRIPVYSLYGPTRKPTPAMLSNVDVLLFDIQDVGARYYTYISTLAYAMQAAAEKGIPFIVLDRPNPIGGVKVEGPVLEPAYSSFVGLYPIAVRHGMTVGELARLFNDAFGIGAKLTVVAMSGWRREMDWKATGLPWIKPSPNIVRPETALVYPGTCLLEGTNVSEGRGSPLPFEMIGAPWIEGERLARVLNEAALPGVRFEPTSFVPTTSKFQGQRVEGVQIVVTDPGRFEAVRTGLTIIATLRRLYPADFRFTLSGGKYYFDTLIGNGWMRPAIEQGQSVDEILARDRARFTEFLELRRRYLLYE